MQDAGCSEAEIPFLSGNVRGSFEIRNRHSALGCSEICNPKSEIE